MTFDRKLSLEIDLCLWRLDELHHERGMAAAIRRWLVRRRLRRLERRIPCSE